MGLRGVGHRGGTTRPMSGTAASTRSITRSTRTTAMAPGTTRGPARYGRGAACVRTVRRRRRRRALQPEDRHLCARRRRVRSVRRARRRAAYNPRTGTYARTRGRRRLRQLGIDAVQRGDQWASDARVTNRATGTTTRVDARQRRRRGDHPQRPRRQQQRRRAHRQRRHLRRPRRQRLPRQDGGWQKYDNGSWGSANTPTRQLDRDRAARAEGATRTRDYGAARSSGGTRSTGSYRPSARDARGGGGRRR